MNRYFFTAVLAVGQFIVYGQQKRLNIGDALPLEKLGRFTEPKGKDFLISDYKGKVVILDFWNVRCGTCIAGMPKMEALQREFGNQIEIVLVTQDTEQEVQQLFERKLKYQRPRLPMITSDKKFYGLFPHEGDPLHVWIDTKGIVRHITGSHNATQGNIKALLAGAPQRLSVQSVYSMDEKQPLLSVENHHLVPLATYYSVFMKGLHEYSYSNSMKVVNDFTSKKPTGIQIKNATIPAIVQFAFNRDVFGFDISPIELPLNNRMMVEVTSPVAFTLPYNVDSTQRDEWMEKNLFSYELMVPEEKSSRLFEIMQEDIRRFFDYEVVVEKRKMQCLVLVRKGGSALFKNNTDEKGKWDYTSEGYFQMNNLPVSSFLKMLIIANQKSETPIIDGTNYTGNIRLLLRSKMNDLPQLALELNEYGLDLRKEEREIDMLIVRDRR